MRRDTARAACIIAVLIVLAAWSAGGPPAAQASPGPGGQAATDADTRAKAEPSLRRRVLNLDIFYGGDELNLQTGTWCSRPDGCPEMLAKVIKTIRAASPDIVSPEERDGAGPEEVLALEESLRLPAIRDSCRAVHADPVTVPGFRWDWLGIHAPGAVEDNPNATTCEVSYCGNTRSAPFNVVNP